MNIALRFPKRYSARRLCAAGLVLILLALASQAVHAQDHFPQRIDRSINDYAHLLTSADAASLQTICSDLTRNKGVELYYSLAGHRSGATIIHAQSCTIPLSATPCYDSVVHSLIDIP